MLSERLSPIGMMRRHGRLTVFLLLSALAAGLCLAMLRPTIYTAEARLGVGGNAGLAAEAVPGYALASQQLAANYARYVNNAQSQAALEVHLGVRPGVVQQISASPIPESNVVRIEVTARVAATAKDAAGSVADSLMKQVNDTSRTTSAADATLAEFTKISGQVAAAQQASDAAKGAVTRAEGQPGALPNLNQLTQAAADAAAHLAILQVQQDALGQKYRNQVASLSEGAANLSIVEAPVVTGSNRIPQFGQFGLAGLMAGAVLALLVSVLLERRRAPETLPISSESAGSWPRGTGFPDEGGDRRSRTSSLR